MTAREEVIDVAERNRARRYSYRIDWDNEARLGVWSDAELARALGVVRNSVVTARKVRGIAPAPHTHVRQGSNLDRLAKSMRTEIQHLRKTVLDQGNEIKEMRRLFSRCDECGAEPGHLCVNENDIPTATHSERGL